MGWGKKNHYRGVGVELPGVNVTSVTITEGLE